MRRAALARSVGAPLIATNDVMMHRPERRALADVLTCIREKTTLEAAGRLTQANAERHIKAPREMERLFAEAPDAVAETIRFLDGLEFSLDELSHCYPEELREGYPTAQEALEAFARAGAESALSGGNSRPHAGSADARTQADRLARLRALLPHRARHRALRALEGNSLSGPRLGGQFRGLLLPRDYRGRSGALRSPVRALHLARAQRASRHRRRLRARAARGGDPVHL